MKYEIWLEYWIPSPGAPGLKPMGGFKVNTAFHPSEVGQMSTGISWGLSSNK